MKWIYRFFVVLGVVFFLILVAVTYFVIVDPFHVRPLLMSVYERDSSINTTVNPEVQATGETAVVATTTGVTSAQAQALQSVGISPTSVPTQFTPAQTTCFVNILGQERVDEIVAGAIPSPTEFYQAKDCM